ncbi:MAG: ROK family protein [Chloroflexi bacterium]|nr:ROK family protein [Chloroflexota bacterium]NOG33418.1 ROK family protein [Chloroflexota bacterium]
MDTGILFGGIEAGGTKFVCAVGTGPGDIRAEIRFPTTTPAENLSQCLAFFREQGDRYGELTAVGIASFGPVDPDPRSSTFGYITTTPKPGWANTDFAGVIGRALGVPVGFDTDVNGAALGEWRWGAAQGLDTFIYLTIGTGIGGGVMVNGRLLHGLIHPEMGHIPLPHDWAADPFPGRCPYHGDCLEGMASGPAIADRWGQPGSDLPSDHPAWELEAHYLALALHSFICTLSPQRIIMGGGVMAQPQIFPLLRQKVQASLRGYVQHTAVLENIDRYIVPPALGGQAGVAGAIALAELASKQ